MNDRGKITGHPEEVHSRGISARSAPAHPTVTFVAVTGAQGVGKSTFCGRLRDSLIDSLSVQVEVLGGLRSRMESMGVGLGSASTAPTIPAVFSSHLEREFDAPPGLTILDRCVVDALAYTRALAVTSPLELRLYEAVAAMAARNLALVVHLRLTSPFLDKGSIHEAPKLRHQVADLIADIIASLGLPVIELDAAADDSLMRAEHAISNLLSQDG